MTLSGSPVLHDTHTQLDFDWGSGSPHLSVSPDRFSARWARYIDVAAGTCRFTATSDDGIRIYVDGRVMLDVWYDHAVQTFTAVEWQPVEGAAKYHLYNRRTDQPYWQAESMVETDATRVELLSMRGDDWLFGVSSVSADGAESPIASAVPGGAFAPLAGD